MPNFLYFEPHSVEEALDLLAEYGELIRPIAGGTDLILDVHVRHFPAWHLLSLTSIPSINFIRVNDALHIGATTVFQTIHTSQEVKTLCEMLTEAAGTIGSRQNRNIATIGGNICNALPCADSVPSLVAMDAEVVITWRKGTRRMLVADLIIAPRRTRLQQGELVTEVIIPLQPPHSASTYLTNNIRKALDLSNVGVATMVTMADDGETIRQARIAIANCSRAPLRATQAEDMLAGRRLTEELLDEVSRLAIPYAKVRDTTLRASAEYRREMAGVLVKRGLKIAHQRARAGYKD
jgi:CO/xanthine dehydrogenase FAD-binding subunit